MATNCPCVAASGAPNKPAGSSASVNVGVSTPTCAMLPPSTPFVQVVPLSSRTVIGALSGKPSSRPIRSGTTAEPNGNARMSTGVASAAPVIVCPSMLPALRLVMSPLYPTLMPWGPGDSDDVAHAALDDTASMGTRGTASQPAIAVAPSANATVPRGLFPVTVAVNVTSDPAGAGLAELRSGRVVAPVPVRFSVPNI